MKIFGFDHPFFLPLWRRIFVVVVCLAWSLVEFANGATGWAVGIGCLGLISAWGLLIKFDATAAEAKRDRP